MNFTIETEREDDVRWTAELPPSRYAPSALEYGATCGQAMIKAEGLDLPASSSC